MPGSGNTAYRLEVPALRLYALIELFIGVSGVAVPYELRWGGRLMERLDLSSSVAYYCISGVWVALYVDSVVRADGSNHPRRDASDSADC